MTEHEIELGTALGLCSFLPASAEKRFARNMAFLAKATPERELTERQRYYLEIMAWRYRRQLPRHLVPAQKPLDLPPKRKPDPSPKILPTPSEQLGLL